MMPKRPADERPALSGQPRNLPELTDYAQNMGGSWSMTRRSSPSRSGWAAPVAYRVGA
jgi:hypothetical protein